MEALIADLDGTLVNTQKYHAQVEAKILKEYGIHVSAKEITRKYAGVSTRKMFQDYLGDQCKNGSLDALVERKFELLAELVDSLSPQDLCIPHAQKIVQNIWNKGYKVGIATASKREYAERILFKSGLLWNVNNTKGKQTKIVSGYIDQIVTGDDVLYGKPEPDIFLECARRLGVRSECCAVVEDGISGMIGAQKAGMLTFGLVENEPSSFDDEVRKYAIPIRSWKVVDIFFPEKRGQSQTVSDIVYRKS